MNKNRAAKNVNRLMHSRKFSNRIYVKLQRYEEIFNLACLKLSGKKEHYKFPPLRCDSGWKRLVKDLNNIRV